MKYLSTLLLATMVSIANSESLKKNERIVFLGDSITQGGARPGGYVDLFKKKLASDHSELGATIIGAGISGNKVPDLQRRLERDVLSKKPTLVFIYIGINDVWHWNRNKGTKKDVFEAGLKDIISKIEAKGARVILCTPTVIGEKTDGSNKFDSMLEEYSSISRGVAKATGSQLLDLRKSFMEHLRKSNTENNDRGLLTRDTVHMNAEGNKFLARLFLGAVGIK